MKPKTIDSIMTRDVICVTPEQKIIDVKHIYEKRKFHHHIPVTENDELVGMISLIDFMYRIKGAGLDDSDSIYHELMVKDIMTTSPYFRSATTTIDDIAEEFIKGHYRAIPIVEGKKVVGIVSTADVIKHYLHQPYAK